MPQHLSLRHTEILLLLSMHPGGLTAEELGVALDARDLDPVTVRAEVSRLRRVVGVPSLLARPYRLAGPLRTDAARVRHLLDAGRVADAVAAYPGPLLPRSQAPAVERMRDELAAELRGAVLRCGDVDALRAWAESPCGAEDVGAWTVLTRSLPGGAARARAEARARLLDRRFG